MTQHLHLRTTTTLVAALLISTLAACGGSGDSKGSGATGPMGGKPPAPAASCTNLPGAGTWQNITPASNWPRAVNGTVGAAIIVDPFEPNRLWLGTGGENDEIWRSDNCGGSWTRVNTGPGSVGDNRTYGGVGDGAQWSMAVDFSIPNTLYAVSGYGAQSLWKSTDGGTSWTDVMLGTEYDRVADYRFANNISIDPSDSQHLVISTHGGCTGYTPGCMAETLDGGRTWRTLKAPEGFWEGGGIVIVRGGLWVWCGFELLVSEDSGATWHEDRLAGGGTCEAQYTIRPLNRAANGNYYLGSRGGVLRSRDGKTWEHVPGGNGVLVMLAQGGDRLFAADQWRPTIRTALLSNDESWSDLPAPPQISQGTDGGIPFLAYDPVHRILYASMFSGGVVRAW